MLMLDLALVAAALLTALTWIGIRLPRGLFPVHGRWLRYLFMGATAYLAGVRLLLAEPMLLLLLLLPLFGVLTALFAFQALWELAASSERFRAHWKRRR